MGSTSCQGVKNWFFDRFPWTRGNLCPHFPDTTVYNTYITGVHKACIHENSEHVIYNYGLLQNIHCYRYCRAVNQVQMMIFDCGDQKVYGCNQTKQKPVISTTASQMEGVYFRSKSLEGAFKRGGRLIQEGVYCYVYSKTLAQQQLLCSSWAAVSA